MFFGNRRLRVVFSFSLGRRDDYRALPKRSRGFNCLDEPSGKSKNHRFVRLPDLRFLLENSEFIVLPAVYSIAASGPLAQVFAHEKAVIVSDLGVYREEIVNNFNGLLAKAADAEDLRDKIITLIENPQLVKTISENVAGVKKERSWSTVAGQTIKVYLETREGRFPF